MSMTMIHMTKTTHVPIHIGTVLRMPTNEMMFVTAIHHDTQHVDVTDVNGDTYMYHITDMQDVDVAFATKDDYELHVKQRKEWTEKLDDFAQKAEHVLQTMIVKQQDMHEALELYNQTQTHDHHYDYLKAYEAYMSVYEDYMMYLYEIDTYNEKLTT